MNMRCKLYHLFTQHLEKEAIEAYQKQNFEKAYAYRCTMIRSANKYSQIIVKEQDRLSDYCLKLPNFHSHLIGTIYAHSVVIFGEIKLTVQVFWNIIIKKGK